MSHFKTNLTAILISLGLSGAGGRACTAGRGDANQRGNNSTNNKSPQQSGSAEVVGKPSDGKPGDFKVLAEGGYGQVGDPFVAVARDPEVYGALRGMVRGLPELDADFLKSNAVAAVFVGLRNTGGYSVELTRDDRGQLLVSERTPPPDVMTTQALTTPFKVVSVPTKAGENINLILQPGLAASMLRPYRVTSGEFITVGGLPQRGEKFRVEGELRLARSERLATVFFDLKGVGAQRSRVLRTIVTGIIDERGRFSMTGVGGALVGGATTLLRVTGQFTGDDDKLQLSFESLPTEDAGGFVWAGKLNASALGPAPARAKPNESIY